MVDWRCRESEGKAKIEGYMSISDEAHHQRRIFFVGEVITIVVGVSSGQVLELMQSASGDIYKFVKRRNVYVLVGERWNDLECCDWMVKY